jgi:cytidylate kinase
VTTRGEGPGEVIMIGDRSSEPQTEAMERVLRHASISPRGRPTAGKVVMPAYTIAISREAGANGTAVAQAVAERQGWPVYNQELLRVIAGKMEVGASLLESVDEKHCSWVEDCVDALGLASAVPQCAFVHHLVTTLLSLAAHGGCVIVGRGAAQVLPPARTLRVRLVGPREERIHRVRDRLGVSHAEAARWVERIDHDRAQFVRDHFHKDPADPAAYDLVLNSSRFSAAECAELILDALRRFQARLLATTQAAASV